MNKISFNLVSFLLGLAALTVALNPMSARAEAPSTHSSLESATSASTSIQSVEPASKSTTTTNITSSAQSIEPEVLPASAIDQLGNHPTATAIWDHTAGQRPVQQANSVDINPYQSNSQSQLPLVVSKDSPASPSARTKDITGVQRMPEKLETSADYLAAQPSTDPLPVLPSNQTDSQVAQDVNIEPGRSTRGGSSYIGIGGNLGLGGNPALGEGAFMINSKIGLTRNISFRPAVLFGDDVDFLLPLTYDFVIQSADPFAPVPFAPFLGGGVIVSTNGDNDIGFLLTGGVDVPLSAQFVANASISVGFRDDTDVGLMLGVGYTFPGFSR